MSNETVQNIGWTIVRDTASLISSLEALWQQLETIINGDPCGDNLPACLQQDFRHYAQQEKQELDHMLQKRQQIGKLLITSSSFSDFRKQLGQPQFVCIDIYSANNYYDSGKETIPVHLRLPEGFTHLTP